MPIELSKWLKPVLINLAVFALLFVAIEGLSSATVFTYRLAFDRNSGLQSRTHVQYDETLGWINVPNLNIESMYGEGRHFVTNSQSFRNRADFPKQVPAGKTRIICSGDSFTLGIGVGNDDTLCAQLEKLDPSLETANLGEAGYDIGQIYLKYQRDAAKLEHDIHLISFISDDIRRMKDKRFVHYPKPRFVLRDGELYNDNFPVPQRSSLSMFFALNMHLFQELRTVELANRIWSRIAPRSPVNSGGLTEDEIAAIAIALFKDIARENKQRGIIPVFVFLMEDIRERPVSVARRTAIKNALTDQGFIFIDLVEEFRPFDSANLSTMFDPEWTGHYTADGNRRVAKAIYAHLEDLF